VCSVSKKGLANDCAYLIKLLTWRWFNIFWNFERDSWTIYFVCLFVKLDLRCSLAHSFKVFWRQNVFFDLHLLNFHTKTSTLRAKKKINTWMKKIITSPLGRGWLIKDDLGTINYWKHDHEIVTSKYIYFLKNNKPLKTLTLTLKKYLWFECS